jgi:hypothetical protein
VAAEPPEVRVIRRTRLRRSEPPKRGGKIKPKPRSASEKQRIYGPKGRVEFVKSLPCANCGTRAFLPVREIVNAHTATGGTGRKADYTTIVPLCSNRHCVGCHDIQHRLGWVRLRHLDTREKREAAAAATESAWQAHQLSLS